MENLFIFLEKTCRFYDIIKFEASTSSSSSRPSKVSKLLIEHWNWTMCQQCGGKFKHKIGFILHPTYKCLLLSYALLMQVCATASTRALHSQALRRNLAFDRSSAEIEAADTAVSLCTNVFVCLMLIKELFIKIKKIYFILRSYLQHNVTSQWMI